MFKKIIALAFSLVLILTLLTACAGNDAPTDVNVNYEATRSLVLCVQNTANTASPMLGDSEISNTVYDTVRASGAVTVIEVDGDAHTIDKISADIPENVSAAKKTSIAKQVSKQILSVAGSAVPKTGEVDTLKGLINAARNLDSSCDEKTVLYLGSALQTTGYINFSAQNLFDTDTEVIVSQLKEKSAIPEFPEGTTVIFAGLGDTAAPQKNLTYSQIAKLDEILTAICKEGGAEVDHIRATPVSEVNVADFPKVSTVTVLDDYVEGTSISGALKIDSTQISFKGDSYELSDKSAATEFLAPYVESINATNDTIFVCGTTATVGDSDTCREFSLKRAQTIVDLLTEMGVDPSRIKAKGLGYDNVFHSLDTDKDGVLIEKEAQKNRLVLIIPSSCEDASKI